MRILDLNDPLVLTHSLVVSASAGSGKTYTLTVLVTQPVEHAMRLGDVIEEG